MLATYESSNRVPSKFVGMLAGGLVVVLIAAFVYDRLLWWIQDTRWAVLGILLAGGMATGLWFLGRELTRRGKCRNPVAAMVGMGALAAVVIIASPWMRYYAARSTFVAQVMHHATEINAHTLAEAGVYPQVQGVKANDTAFADDAATTQLIRGTFPFGEYWSRRVAAGWNIALFGHPWPMRDWWVVYPVWIIEALMLVGAAALGARSVAVLPFDENGDTWFTQEEVFRLNSTPQTETYRLARATEFAHLLVLPRPTPGPGYTVRYMLAKPAYQTDPAYLTIQQESDEAGQFGRSHTAIRYLHYWVALDPAQTEQLLETIRDVDSSGR